MSITEDYHQVQRTIPMFPETNVELLMRMRDPAERESAWRDFWAQYREHICNWAQQLQMGGDQGEEIVARVMAKLVQKMPTFAYDPQKKFRGWLKTVTRNVVFDYMTSLDHRPGSRGVGSGAEESVEVIAERSSDSLVEVLNSALELRREQQQRAIENILQSLEQTSWTTSCHPSCCSEGDTAGPYTSQDFPAFRFPPRISASI